MNKRERDNLGGSVGTRVGQGVGAIVVVLMTLFGFAQACAATALRPTGSAAGGIPFAWSGSAPSPWPCWIKPLPSARMATSAPVPTARRPALSPARIQYLKRQERLLRHRMWQLRLRRRTFLAEGRPQHAHKISKRLLSLGWRLRQIQAEQRAAAPN